MAKDLEFTANVGTDLFNAGGKGEVLKKLIDAWNSKNAVAGKRVGTFGFMAATLSACGGGEAPSSDSQGQVSTFSFNVEGAKASLSGVFAGLTGSGVQEISFAAGTEVDALVDTQAVPDTEVLLDGASELILQNGVTLVGAINDNFNQFDVDTAGVSVSGDGNVWILVGSEEGSAGEYSARLDIVLLGGDLTFDMPSDADSFELLDGSIINLNGGTLIVSDGVVSANLSNVQFLNIGDIVLNSELIVTYDQFAEKLESGDITISGTGKLTVVVDDDSQSQEFFDALIADPSILGGSTTTVVVQNLALNVTSEVDPLSLLDSKISYLAKVLQAEIDALKAGQGEDYDGATFKTIAAISAKLESLGALIGSTSVSDQIDAAFDGLTTDYGAAISTAIDDLEAKLQGEGFDVATDLASFEAISDAIALLNAADNVPGSVASDIDAAFDALTTAYTDAISTAFGDLKAAIEGEGYSDTTLKTLSELSGAIDALNGDLDVNGSVLSIFNAEIGDLPETDVDGRFIIDINVDTVAMGIAELINGVLNYADANAAALEGLGEGFWTEGDYQTLSALNDAVQALEASLGEGSVTEQLSELTSQLESYADDAISALETKLSGDLGEGDYATLKDLSNAATMLEAINTGDAQTPGTVAYRLAKLNVALEIYTDTEIEDLKSAIEGLGEGSWTEGDYQTLSALNDAIQSLEAALGESSVGDQIDAAFDALTTNYGTAISTAIDDLEAKLQGEGFDVATDLASFEAISDAIALLNAADNVPGSVASDIGAAFDALTTAYTDAISTAFGDLEAKLQGEGFDVATDLATFEAISGAIRALQGATSGDGGATETLISLQSQLDDLAAAIDVTAPTVTSVTLSSVGADSSGVLNAGDVVTATVTFSEAVLVTGTPTLDLDIGGEVDAVYVGGAGTDQLTFEYSILPNQTDLDGISVPENALQTAGGNTIKDSWGNEAETTFAAISADASFTIDNGPLALTYSAGALFGADLNADTLVVGLKQFGQAPADLTYSDISFVVLSDLSSANIYVVPEDVIFLSPEDYIYLELTGDVQIIEDRAIQGPATVSIDFSDKLVWNVPDGPTVVLTEAALRDVLTFGPFQALISNENQTFDEYIAANTLPASTIALYDGFLAGETLGADIIDQLDGHDPATVDLTITTPLTLAQATALQEAGFDLANVTFSIRDYDTTVQGALLLSSAADVLRDAELVTAIGDEIDNEAMRFTSFDQRVNLRIEALEGDDQIDAGRGDDQIVGGLGSDVIELTYKDGSNDTVIYQTIHDGQTLPVITLTFSSDADLYLEGSILSATINGQTVVYEVASPTETPEEAVANLANLASLTLSEIDPAKIIVGVMIDMENALSSEGELDVDFFTSVTLADFENGQYTVPQTGEVFIPYGSFIGANLLGDSLYSFADMSVEEFFVQVAYYGVEGGQTFSITNEKLFYEPDLSSDLGTEQYILASEEFLSNAFIDPATYADYVADFQVLPSSQILSGVTSVGATVTFYGADASTGLEVSPGTDSVPAISNPGQKSRWKVEFSDVAGDYLDNESLGGTFEFDRQVSVTIGEETVTANIVYTAPDQADPAATIAALKTAVEAEMGVGGALENILGSVSVASNGSADVILVLEGKFTPIDDTVTVPTFTVNSAAIDVAGEQQQTTLNFSSDNADYYEGGTLSVEIAGQTVTADMIVGDAVGSVEALKREIDLQISGGLDVPVNTALAAAVEIVEQTVDPTFISIGENATEGASWVGASWLSNGEENRYRDIDDLLQDGSLYTTNAYSWDGRTVWISQDDLTEASVSPVDENWGELIQFASWDDFAAAWQVAFRRVMADDNDSLTVTVVQEGDITKISVRDTDQIGSPNSGQFDFWISNMPTSGLTVTAAKESPDPLNAIAVQTYEGEYQQATISLEDGSTYQSLSNGEDVSVDREVGVYHEGGKVYLTITEASPDVVGDSGVLDSFYVDALMGADATETSQNLVDAINERITGVDSTTPDTPAIVTIEGDFVGTEVFTNYGGATFTISGAIDGSGFSGFFLINTLSYSIPVSGSNLVYDYNLAYMLSGSAAGVSSSFSETFTMNDLMSYLSAQPEIDSASIDVGTGDIVITSAGSGADTSLSVSFNFGNSPNVAIALTDALANPDGSITKSDTGEDGVAGQAGTPGDLAGFIGSAELGLDGTITLTAANAGKEFFEVSDVRMDYQGVQQVATFSLADGVSYNDYSYTLQDAAGQVVTPDRPADIYFNGGQAYATITDFGADGVKGGGDDTDFTVSVAMGEDVTSTSQALVDAINDRITGVDAVPSSETPAIVIIEGEFDGTEALSNGAVRLFTIEGQIDGGSNFLRSFLITHYSDYFVEADSYILENGVGGGFYNGWPVFDLMTLDKLLTFLTSLDEINSASIDVDTGDIVITSAGTGLDTSLAVTLSFLDSPEFATALTDAAEGADGYVSKYDTGDDSVLQGGIPADMADVLESAALGFDGTVTLTGKVATTESFEISDVRLDYEGVKQIATVTLDGATEYSEYSYDDGAGSAVFMRADAQPGVYFNGGKVYADIDVLDSEGAVERTVTVSADMVPERPDQIVLTLSAVDETALTDDMVFDYGTEPARVILNPESIAQEEINIVESETLGSFIANLDAVSFVTRAELSNGAVEITIDTTQLADSKYVLFVTFFADVSFGGKMLQVDNTETVLNASVEPRQSTNLTTVNAAVETTSALADAIQAEIAGDLAGVLSTATTDGTTITLEAAEAGKQTFKVSDITLDYAGVKQIAEVDFSQLDDGESSPISYYDGGNLAVTIKATDANGNLTGEDIVITADMADGATDVDTDTDAEGTLAALVQAIQDEIDGALAGIVSSVTEDGGVITLTSADNVKQQFTVTAASASDEAKPEITTVSYSSDVADYFETGVDLDATTGRVSITIDGQTYSANMVEGDPAGTAQALLAVLEAPVTGLDPATATVTLEVTEQPVGQQWSLESTNAYKFDDSTSVVLYDDQALQDKLALYDAFTVSDFDFKAQDFADDPTDETVTFSTDTLYTSLEDWAADAQAYLRTIDDPALTVTYDSLEGALKFQSGGKIYVIERPTLFFTETEVSDVTFTVTGAVVNEALSISGTASVDATRQVTEVDLSGVDELSIIGGIGRELSVSISEGAFNQTFTADGGTRLELLQNLKAAIDTAIADDTTNAGIGALLESSGVVVDENDLTLSLTARYGGVTPFTVSTPTLPGIDFDDPGTVAQQLALGFTGTFLDSLLAGGDTLTFQLGKTEVDVLITGGLGATRESVLGEIETALNGVQQIETAVPGDGRSLLLTAAFVGENVLGTVSDGQDNTVKLSEGADEPKTPITTGFFAEETQAGGVVFLADPVDTGTRTVTTDGVDFVAEAADQVVSETTQAAKAETQEGVDYTNAGFGEGDDSGFFGDAAQDGDDGAGGYNGEGIDQSFQNPEDSYTATSGSALYNVDDTGEGDATFYGDDYQSIGEGGDGIQQEFINPGAVDLTEDEYFQLSGLSDGTTFKYLMFAGDEDVDDGYRYTQAEIYDFVASMLDGNVAATTFAGLSNQHALEYEDDLYSDEWNDAGGDIYDGGNMLYVDGELQYIWDVNGATDTVSWGDYDFTTFSNGTLLDVSNLSADEIVIQGELGADGDGGVDIGKFEVAGHPTLKVFFQQNYGAGDPSLVKIFVTDASNPVVSVVSIMDQGYYGDDPLTVAVDGAGVIQTHTNPDSGYTAFDGSPQLDGEDTGEGNSDLFGSAQGYYDDEGLWTSYLNGATPGVSDGEGSDLFVTDSSGEDLTDIIDVDGTVNVGADATTSDLAGEDIVGDRDGFAPFTWDAAETDLITLGTDEADLILNFQTGEGADLIQLEGDLAASTIVGAISGRVGEATSEIGVELDLSNEEFGLVASAESTLDEAELAEADLVAELLNKVYDFDGAFAGTLDNGELNSTIFAVTASDDDSVTAIWAHQQSSADDSTVEALELYQLATVNTINGEFSLENFGGLQDILHSQPF